MSRRSFKLPVSLNKNNKIRTGSIMLPFESQCFAPSTSYYRAEESEDCMSQILCPAFDSQKDLNSPCTCGLDALDSIEQTLKKQICFDETDHESLKPTSPIYSAKFHPNGLTNEKSETFINYQNNNEPTDKQTTCLGKCLLCLILNTIFISAIIIALFIGHIASDIYSSEPSNQSNHTSFMPLFANISPTNMSNASLLLNYAEHEDKMETWFNNRKKEQLAQFFEAKEKAMRIRVPRLHEIYPPSLSDPELDGSSDMEWRSLGDAMSLNYREDINTHRSFRQPKEVPLTPLPENILPKHYDIRLDFTQIINSSPQLLGNVSILFEFFGSQELHNEIIFHAATNVFILRIQLFDKDGKNINIRSVERNSKLDFVHVFVGGPFHASHYKLVVEFRTSICASEAKGSSEGVHCFYQNSNNDKQVVSGFSTKFEPCFARTFLPGWDEPRIRSTFNVSIQHFSDVVVLTNTAPIKDKIAKNVESPKQSNSMMEKITRTIVISQFEPTPAMPLYLLSFAMGPFVPIELHNIMNFPLKIWSFPFDTFNLQFAANFSPIMFDRIQKDFGVKYPLTKMDFFVTPNFPVGGMENWGLVIFHSSAIKVAQQSEPSLEALSKTTTALKNESNAEHSETTNHDKRKPQKQRQHSILTMIDHLSEQYRVEKVITHEIVHQWFGNLVTMRDWSELWLNEGFASYFVFDHLNVNHPYLTEHEYYLKLIELTEKQTTSGNQGLPLIHSPKHSIELYKMFDGVNLYTKGAVIVKMIKDLIGSTEFRKGMTKYLIRNAYKSVDSQALWNSLPALCDHGTGEQPTLEDALNPWLFNSGMPELIISRSQNDQSIRILQRRSDQNRYIVYLQDDYKLDNGADENSSVVNQQMKRPNRSYQKRRVKSQSKNYWHKNDFFEESHPIKRYQNRNRHKKRARNSYKSATPKTTVFTERETTKNNDIFYEESQKRSNEYYYNEFKSENSKVFPFGPIFDADQSMYSKSSNALQSRKFRASDEHSKNDEPKAPLWSIPFAYSFVSVKNLGGRVLRQFWLRNETTRFVDNEMERTDFMLANPHWINYDLNNWILLIKQLQKNHNYLPVMSRIQLIFDAEMYLKQSAIPSVYVNLLSYLKHETDLGVLLVGLDSIHRLLKMFVATELIGPLLMHLVPAIRQIDKQLSFDDNDKDMPQDPELLAIWLLNPLRLTKLYQLRCLANLDSCDENIQVKKWLKHPTALDAENHRQIIAICSHFFTRATDKEIAVLARLIEQYQYRLMDTTSSDADFDATSGKLIAIIQQLAINCVRDEALLQRVVDEIIKTRNAVIYSSILDSVYSIQYNRKFRELFWKRLSQKLNLHERELLFAVNTGHSDWMARLLLHSIRSLGELNLVEKIVLPKWPERLRVHITYLRRKFKWIENDATRNIQKYLITNSS